VPPDPPKASAPPAPCGEGCSGGEGSDGGVCCGKWFEVWPHPFTGEKEPAGWVTVSDSMLPKARFLPSPGSWIVRFTGRSSSGKEGNSFRETWDMDGRPSGRYHSIGGFSVAGHPASFGTRVDQGKAWFPPATSMFIRTLESKQVKLPQAKERALAHRNHPQQHNATSAWQKLLKKPARKLRGQGRLSKPKTERLLTSKKLYRTDWLDGAKTR